MAAKTVTIGETGYNELLQTAEHYEALKDKYKELENNREKLLIKCNEFAMKAEKLEKQNRRYKKLVEFFLEGNYDD